MVTHKNIINDKCSAFQFRIVDIIKGINSGNYEEIINKSIVKLKYIETL